MTAIVLCLLAIVITSYLIGALFTDADRGLFATLILGFLCELAIWEIVTLPSIYMQTSLTTLSVCVMSAVTAVSVVSIIKKGTALLAPWQSCFKDWIGRIKRFFTLKAGLSDVLVLVALGIVLMQALLLVIGVHYDDDDAFYVATATTAIDTDTIYHYTPFTGAEYSEFPARYVLSPWSMLPAVLSRIFGIRPIIIFHTLLPVIIIPMSYGAIWLLGRVIWRSDDHRSEKSWGFVIAVSFLQIFGAFSTWSAGMRLLIRPWQGKTVLASVIIPLLFVLLIYDWRSEKLSRYMGFYILVTMLAGCFLSSMGIVLPVIELFALALTRIIVNKNIRYSLSLIPCCIPNVLLGVIYLLIR